MANLSGDTTVHDLKLLSIGYYIQGGLFAGYTLLAGLYFCFIGAVFSNMPPANGNNLPPTAVHIFAVIFGVIVLLGFAYAVLQFLAAYWLTRRRARGYTLVIAALNCFCVPYGTVLGIFTFLVLQRPAAKELFGSLTVRELGPVQSPFAVNPDVPNH